jgi:hypothetical protein
MSELKISWTENSDVKVEEQESTTGDSFLNEVISYGFTPILSTLKEDEEYFYVYCEQECWLRGGK